MPALPTVQENKPFALVLIVLFVSLIVFIMAKTYHTVKSAAYIDEPTPYEHQITIEGTGKAYGKPDVATVSMTVETKAESVAEAQKQNTETTNKLIQQVKEAGIAEDDVQSTGYNAYEEEEEFDWMAAFGEDGEDRAEETDEEEPATWIVDHTLTVKVRDTAKISDVLAIAGQNGATGISGPSFMIDDLSPVKAEARKKALEDAARKAKEIAKSLGIELEQVISYSEWANEPSPSPFSFNFSLGMSDREETASPDIATGSNEVMLNVSVTYKLAD
ncbi:SIMPL domain-containing protein [Candidatus Uhrbacteria bacterium]|nr:SIMPL domain-containing protein [Candidatus Uhrbacteria bacterium]